MENTLPEQQDSKTRRERYSGHRELSASFLKGEIPQEDFRKLTENLPPKINIGRLVKYLKF